MQYKTKIYISDVTNLSDARYAAGMLVDYIGFPLDSSMDKFLDLHTFNAITGWLEGINIVVEFNTMSIKEINNLIESEHIKIISLPYNRLKDATSINAQVILRDAPTQQTEQLSEKILFLTTKTTQKSDYFLEDFYISNIDILLKNPNIKGIILKGSEEERPGYKDYDEIADIIDYLEV